MTDIFDIYLLEAMVKASCSAACWRCCAGLNLIFGHRRHLDLLRELVMMACTQYYWSRFSVALLRGRPFTFCWSRARGAVASAGDRSPALGAAINQLLATGGVLFVLQSFATVAFGIDFRNSASDAGAEAGRDAFQYSRLLAFAAALIA